MKKYLFLLIIMFLLLAAGAQKRDTLSKDFFSQETTQKFIAKGWFFLEIRNIVYGWKFIDGKYQLLPVDRQLAIKLKERHLAYVYLIETKL